MRRAFLLAAAVGLVLAAPAATAGRKKVGVYDNYYLPNKLTVPKNSTIVWKWPAEVGDVHDVKLGKHPKGAKTFWSEPGASGYSFTRKLTIPGTYRIVCTLHEEMTMTITVRP